MNPADNSAGSKNERLDNEPAVTNSREETILADEQHNLFVLSLHYITLRVAWVFKTESVIMPMVVDTISGQGWLRGCLPVLNRFGSSIPTIIFADRLRNTQHKKWVLCASTVLMAVPFLFLSALWYVVADKQHAWMAVTFLTCYGFFFMTTGFNQVSFGTLQGKLIRPTKRGLLMSISGIVGSIISITCAWFLLRHWLEFGSDGFTYIFAFTGMGFVVAGVSAVYLAEPADAPAHEHEYRTNQFASAWRVLVDDAEFRQLALVGILFLSIQLLFPHFQALGRKHLPAEAAGFQVMLWVVAQNASVGIFSMFSGAIADRVGNRLAIRLQVIALAACPLLGLWFGTGYFDEGYKLMWIAFFLLGLTPVTMRSITNYTLELVEEEQHPRYLSTLKVCLAIPFLLSPLVGLLVTVLGFEIVFLVISGTIFCGGLLTFRMTEPRDKWDEPTLRTVVDEP